MSGGAMDLEHLCLDRLGMSLDEVVEYILRKTKPPGAGTPDGSKRKTRGAFMTMKTLYHKKKIHARAAALILAGGVLLGGSVLGGHDTARAVEDEEPSVLGYLVIPAKLREEKPVHDKRLITKEAERVEIEPETHEERTEPEPERTACDSEPEREYLGRYRITGYCTCSQCCGKSDGVTASGTTATVGRTCAAPKDIPFGTRLWIEGIGERVVEDRGGAVNGKKIDVLCADHPACYAITGWYDVYVVEE